MNNAEISSAGTVLFPFFRALAHEMSGPLVSVLGYAQLNIEAPSSPEGLTEDLQEIEASAQRLRGHVAVLGRLSRYLPDEQSCSAEDLVADLVLLLTPTARQVGTEIDWDMSGDFSDLQVLGNPWLLRVICLSLLGSACQGTPSPVKISIGLDAGILGISYPAHETPSFPNPEPNVVGCHSLGETLLSQMEASLEKSEESFRIALPLLIT